MFFFLAVILGIPLLDLLWWRWADRKLRPLPRAAWYRRALAVFVLVELGLYAWLIVSRVAGLGFRAPRPLLASAYLWHLVVLPATMVLILIWELCREALLRLLTLIGKRRRQASPANPAEVAEPGSSAPDPAPPPLALTRRQVLAGTLAAVPPLVTGAAVSRGLAQLQDFRVRRFTIPLASLPRGLDGLTIAHVSDLHVGRFTYGKLLRRVVERTNALKADLVLFTGDLIDFMLADLPDGLDVLAKLDPRFGLFACEGNHDLFQDRKAFEKRVRAAGVPLLLDEAATAYVRGEPVQLLGIQWGGIGTRYHREAQLDPHMKDALKAYDPAAFAILLAHHPHAFDYAARAGIPLTLSGHTHGGQLMLTDRIGPGPMMFRYWSGLYRHADDPDAALVVSNGVGNWFPLRVHAPAEIIHLTLRCAGV